MNFDYDFLMLWLADLESGNRLQTIGALRRGDSYCCLGRACDLHDPNAWGPERPKGNATTRDTVIGPARSYGRGTRCFIDENEFTPQYEILPIDVQMRLGFQSPIGAFNASIGMVNSRLTGMNDEGATFKEIASFVRTRPHGLFTHEAEEVLLEKWGPK